MPRPRGSLIRAWPAVAICWAAGLAPGCGARSGLLLPDANSSGGDAPASCLTEGTLAPGQYQNSHRVPGSIALDATTVYWVDAGDEVSGDGAVMSVDKCGGPVVPLAQRLYYPTRLTVDGVSVYCADAGDSGHGVEGGILRVPRAGGPPVTIASLAGPIDVAVDAANVYVLSPQLATLSSVPKGGGALVTLASKAYGPGAVTVDHEYVYWTAMGSVKRVLKSGGPALTLAPGNDVAWLITIDADHVYWATGIGNGIAALMSLDLNSSHAPVALASNVAPTGIAVDGSHLYWTDNGGGVAGAGRVMRIPRTGGAPQTLVSGQSSGIAGIAVDDTSIYWIDDRKVMKRPK